MGGAPKCRIGSPKIWQVAERAKEPCKEKESGFKWRRIECYCRAFQTITVVDCGKTQWNHWKCFNFKFGRRFTRYFWSVLVDCCKMMVWELLIRIDFMFVQCLAGDTRDQWLLTSTRKVHWLVFNHEYLMVPAILGKQ